MRAGTRFKEPTMRIRQPLAILAFSAISSVATAQHVRGGAAPPIHAAPKEATQFDFLIGQWELTVQPKVAGLAARIHGSPRLLGTWKAWRGFDGFGIEDELRIIDGSGNPSALSHAVRVYDAGARRWTVSALDVYRARFTIATGEWRDGQMHLTGKGTDADGKAFLTRTRFVDITPASFRMVQDRSMDEGRTWSEGTLKIDAKRVAAAAPR
jgi:hypothetical protein